VFGQERLIRRHHILAIPQGLKHETARPCRPSDQFHNHVNLRIPDQGIGTAGKERAGNAYRSRPLGTADRDPRDLKTDSGPSREYFSLPSKERINAATDLPEPENANRQSSHSNFGRHCKGARRAGITRTLPRNDELVLSFEVTV
jgi:hypothetical protein